MKYRFGLFEFDGAARELRREGAVVRLQAQPAQVLACLVEAAGSVVSREELRAAIWGGDTFVDFERGLNFCISQVRAALRDDSAEPLYIRTMPKQGYQFIAPVEKISEGAAAESVAKNATPEVAAIHRRVVSRLRMGMPKRMGLWIAFAFLVGLVFAMVQWFRTRHDSAQVSVAMHTPGTTQAATAKPIVAVLRFDNETGDPNITRFSDGLTDNVVEQLTTSSNGEYSVIGNAQILRLPREQRDLTAVGATLHAGFVVMGQVQTQGAQVRILVHLIRLPEQTHLWVVKMDRTLTDPLGLEADAAHKVGTEFSLRLTGRAPSLPSSSH